MSEIAADLLIVYEVEAEQWATYLHCIFSSFIPEAGICCYDVAAAEENVVDLLSPYKCKLLILSRGMLEDLSPQRCSFLGRVLSPAARLVVLLCGVHSLGPLLEAVPLEGGECVQMSSEQDANEYLVTVISIIQQAASAFGLSLSPQKRRPSAVKQKPHAQLQSPMRSGPSSSTVVVPTRIPCGRTTELFVLLKDNAASRDAEVEFSCNTRTVKVKPVHWNDKILCVNAPELPAGDVTVTLHSGGVALSKVTLQYYSKMEELACLLKDLANPVEFMCQAFQVTSVESLDHKLASILLQAMPSGGVQFMQDKPPKRELHNQDIPSLLHFVAQSGFKMAASVLLRCPGAQRALCTSNRQGQTPAEMALSHGHKDLHILLKETLVPFSRTVMDIMGPLPKPARGHKYILVSMGYAIRYPEAIALHTAMAKNISRENTMDGCEDDDTDGGGVYELMSTAGRPPSSTATQVGQQGDEEGEEDPYTLFGLKEHDTDFTSAAVANRPPAPAPRPESSAAQEDQTSFIAQVFKKNLQRGDSLYSAPRQARGRDNISSTYDPVGLDRLIELQERVKRGSLSMEDALEHFREWQRMQKDSEAIQQEKVRQFRANIINYTDPDDIVYDKISIVHHTPNLTANQCRKGSQADSDFYSKTVKGERTKKSCKADKH